MSYRGRFASFQLYNLLMPSLFSFPPCVLLCLLAPSLLLFFGVFVCSKLRFLRPQFIHPTYDRQPSPFNVSHAWIKAYYERLTALSPRFHSCTYANWFEFGWNISNERPRSVMRAYKM